MQLTAKQEEGLKIALSRYSTKILDNINTGYDFWTKPV